MAISRLTLKELVLPKNRTLVSVDYKISRNGQFGLNDLVVNIVKDTVNLQGREFDLDYESNDVYYGKIRLNFNSSGSSYYEGRPVAMTKNGDGFSHNNAVIVTPSVSINDSVNNSELGGFTVTTGEFILFSGVGNHKYSSWYIKDTNGNKVWSKENDKYNLTKIRIPNNILTPNRHYSIEVVYFSDGNQRSNTGKLLLKTMGKSILVNIVEYGDTRVSSETFRETRTQFHLLLDRLVNSLALGKTV